MKSPAHSRRPTLLIVGCGDVGMRVVKLLRGRWRLLALTSSPDRMDALRQAGAVPMLGNLDDAATLGRIGALADAVLHLAPPPPHGTRDTRTKNLLQALARAGRVKRIVYGSTSGVYGDCQGDFFDETRATNPTTDRARRRVDAERRLREFGRDVGRGFGGAFVRGHGRGHDRGRERGPYLGTRVTLLRIPGIYALDRQGGDPRERLVRGTPVLAAADDVHTNHIHADDLARACVAALRRGLPQRVLHVRDDTELKMADYFDLCADLCGLPRPPRVTRAEAPTRLSPMQLSFMSESRRLDNTRLKRELRFRLRYPTVRDGLFASVPVTPT